MSGPLLAPATPEIRRWGDDSSYPHRSNVVFRAASTARLRAALRGGTALCWRHDPRSAPHAHEYRLLFSAVWPVRPLRDCRRGCPPSARLLPLDGRGRFELMSYTTRLTLHFAHDAAGDGVQHVGGAGPTGLQPVRADHGPHAHHVPTCAALRTPAASVSAANARNTSRPARPAALLGDDGPPPAPRRRSSSLRPRRTASPGPGTDAATAPAGPALAQLPHFVFEQYRNGLTSPAHIRKPPTL